MKQITVWTKQHRSVLEQLEKTGRYIARREYIEIENQECAPLVLEVYDWLVQHSPNAGQKPKDVDYPVWLSFAQDTTYLPQEQTVTLKLCIDPALIAPVHIAKWGTILNYSYIPLNEQDARAPSAAAGKLSYQRYTGVYVPFLSTDQAGNYRQLGQTV